MSAARPLTVLGAAAPAPPSRRPQVVVRRSAEPDPGRPELASFTEEAEEPKSGYRRRQTTLIGVASSDRAVELMQRPDGRRVTLLDEIDDDLASFYRAEAERLRRLHFDDD